MDSDTNLIRRGLAAFFAASMLFGVAACGDDDVTDEDIGDVGEDTGDVGDDLDVGDEEE